MDLVREHWGSSEIVTRGKIHDTSKLPGFTAIIGDEPLGLATYRIHGDECEMVSLNSLVEGIGVGSALVDAVAGKAREHGCRRLWLITTNDNSPAQRFCQHRGFTVAAVHKNAIAESRRLKPEIPENGIDGIPIQDEIELELRVHWVPNHTLERTR